MRDTKKQITFVSNWKTNPGSEKEALVLLKQFTAELKKIKQKIIICVPTLFLPALAKEKSNVVALGLQNTAIEDIGAHTGEVSLAQATAYKVKHVIIGHSEVRALGETDELVNKKIKYAIKQKVTPIVCVGEKVRDDGHEYFGIITEQVIKAFAGVVKKDISAVLIAYEPVWAIGKDALRDATPEEFYEVKILIKKVLMDTYGLATKDIPQILYGGSVTEKNAKAFVTAGDADGFLIGRTSLDVKKSIILLNSI